MKTSLCEKAMYYESRKMVSENTSLLFFYCQHESGNGISKSFLMFLKQVFVLWTTKNPLVLTLQGNARVVFERLQSYKIRSAAGRYTRRTQHM